VEATDLRGDLRVHTSAIDGRTSWREKVQAARKRGHSYAAITDHSRRGSVAHGLDASALRRHWSTSAALKNEVPGLAKENLNIFLEKNVLSVSGKKDEIIIPRPRKPRCRRS
jgi:histidinol phosphatase-like PHP family hydrolase